MSKFLLKSIVKVVMATATILFACEYYCFGGKNK